jgi:hypothetical protein
MVERITAVGVGVAESARWQSTRVSHSAPRLGSLANERLLSFSMSQPPELTSSAANGDRRIAAQIVEILNGGKPAEMPYFQETLWELVINFKAAKELRLEIPAELIASADTVIE